MHPIIEDDVALGPFLFFYVLFLIVFCYVILCV